LDVGDDLVPYTRLFRCVETHFGIAVRDPYRWMETQGDELTRWMRAQADQTRAVLDGVPGRAALLERIRAHPAGQLVALRLHPAVDRQSTRLNSSHSQTS